MPDAKLSAPAQLVVEGMSLYCALERSALADNGPARGVDKVRSVHLPNPREAALTRGKELIAGLVTSTMTELDVAAYEVFPALSIMRTQAFHDPSAVINVVLAAGTLVDEYTAAAQDADASITE